MCLWTLAWKMIDPAEGKESGGVEEGGMSCGISNFVILFILFLFIGIPSFLGIWDIGEIRNREMGNGKGNGNGKWEMDI